ncbi:delta-type opioid receptor isoform X2 [Petromyzon marinus]|uniref:Delta-type opioid receptor-like n=1 Tax=Petromyzon marinus TaxID=7757 RepID=A0AAJ7WSS6_PETMA|nr:delta-type opioid receptor-like [Petromyzon marinus]
MSNLTDLVGRSALSHGGIHMPHSGPGYAWECNQSHHLSSSAADNGTRHQQLAFLCNKSDDMLDDDDDYEDDPHVTSLVVAVVITALYSIVCVVGLVGNILVMYVIVRYTKMKTATNTYIFNLALADTLVTTTLPFQSADYLMGSWPFGEVICKVVMSIDYYNMFTSIFTLTIMSVDRYIAVCHPVKALDFRTPSKAKLINICIWILSSAIGIPVIVMGTAKKEEGIIECILDFPHPAVKWENLLKICVFIFAFILPVLIIVVCYSLMVLRLRTVRLLSGSKEKDRNLRRITRMVLIVVAIFVICWTPIHLFVIIKSRVSISDTPTVSAAWYICVALGYTNSCLNPVLYAFLDENFKRCFKEFCFPAAFRRDLQGSSRVGGRPNRGQTSAAFSHTERTRQPA